MNTQRISQRPPGLLRGIARPTDGAQIAQSVRPIDGDRLHMVHFRPSVAAHPAATTPIGNLGCPLLSRERNDLRLIQTSTPLMCTPATQFTPSFTVGIAPFTALLINSLAVRLTPFTAPLIASLAVSLPPFKIIQFPLFAVSKLPVTERLCDLFRVGLTPFLRGLVQSSTVVRIIGAAFTEKLIIAFTVGGAARTRALQFIFTIVRVGATLLPPLFIPFAVGSPRLAARFFRAFTVSRIFEVLAHILPMIFPTIKGHGPPSDRYALR